MLSILFAAGACALATATPIHTIQGHAHRSPYEGMPVTTHGRVTVVAPNGFYLQDPVGDGDDASSDAVFVYTGVQPTVVSGDDVEIEGTVTEYLPGGDPANLSVTEIHPTQVRILARGGNLPYPVLIGTSGRIPPLEVMDDDGVSLYEPASDGIDFWESLEGMRVRIATPCVVGATSVYGEVWVVAEGAYSGMGGRGSLSASLRDTNPERVQVDDILMPSRMPELNCGDRLDDIVGVVGYGFGCFQVLPLDAPTRTASGLAPETSALVDRAGRLRVAAFNVRNLTPTDHARTSQLATIIVDRLHSPALVALEEVQDASGPVSDGTTDASATLDSLTHAIRRIHGPAYHARDIAPEDGRDGGEPGGNIRVALLFDSTRVSFVDRGTPTPSTRALAVQGSDGRVALSVSPARVDPSNPAWDDARKPMAVELRVGDTPLFVVVCHLSSRRGTTPDFGATQPPFDPVSGKRFAQAAIVRDFVQSILAIDPDALVVVAGDFNDDVFSGTLAPLSSSTALFDLHWRLPENERYSYLYRGNAHAYDRILASPSLVTGSEVDIVHTCAEFVNGASDHDPVLASLVVDRPRTAPVHPGAPRIASIFPNPSSGAVRILLDGTRVREAIVFDAHGKRVRAISQESLRSDELWWDGNDDDGRRVASGVYFVRVVNAVGSSVRRVVRLPSRQ